MIVLRSVVNIVDKTGGLKGLCIKVLRGKFFALIGDLFLLSMRSRSARRARLLKWKLQRRFAVGKLQKALLIRSKVNFRRFPGLFIRFFDNSCVIVNRRIVPLSNRIYGPVLKEFCMV